LYFKDSYSPQLGKDQSEFLIEGFRRKCKEKIEAGQLSSTDLEIGKHCISSFNIIIVFLRRFQIKSNDPVQG
jgi:hypothetical protein